MNSAPNNPATRTGSLLLRYGLALVLFWIGGMKFTPYEAAAIEPLVSTSPLMSWLYLFLSQQGVSNLLGVTEITASLLIALGPLAPRVSALGSAVGVLMFCTTLSFLFTLPGWEPTLGGFPALSGSGGFLLKDIVLLGAAVWTLGDSWARAEAA